MLTVPCTASQNCLYGLWKPNEKSAFNTMQDLMLQVLKQYWLPKYLLHCRRELGAIPELVEKFGTDSVTGPCDPEVIDFVQQLELMHRKSSNGGGFARAHSIRMAAMFAHLRRGADNPDDDDDDGTLMVVHDRSLVDSNHVMVIPEVNNEWDEASSDGYPESLAPSGTLSSSPPISPMGTPPSGLKLLPNQLMISDHVITKPSTRVSPTDDGKC